MKKKIVDRNRIIILLPRRKSFITSAANGFVAGIWQLGDHTKKPSWTEWFLEEIDVVVAGSDGGIGVIDNIGDGNDSDDGGGGAGGSGGGGGSDDDCDDDNGSGDDGSGCGEAWWFRANEVVSFVRNGTSFFDGGSFVCVGINGITFESSAPGTVF